MRKTLIATTITSALLLSACSPNDTQNMTKESSAAQVQDINANNVLFKPSPLQYMAPEFDKFGTKEYEAVFDAGITEHTAQVQKIANNPEPATESVIL
jgi:peptidyl-dipeptidase Dcp